VKLKIIGEMIVKELHVYSTLSGKRYMNRICFESRLLQEMLFELKTEFIILLKNENIDESVL